MHTKEIIALLITLAAWWHVVGFAFGLVYVHLSLKSLFGIIPYEPHWPAILRTSDLHLWLSGFVLIGLGMVQKGVQEFLANPKLECKITVVVVWFLATQLMRRVGIRHLKNGNANPMVQLSAISLSCWIYGAFLGCAKPLGDGSVSYWVLLAGFVGVMIISFMSLNYLKNR